MQLDKEISTEINGIKAKQHIGQPITAVSKLCMGENNTTIENIREPTKTYV